MSALSYYAGESWSDHPECVDPVIRQLCIAINDLLPSDAERERVIGPHLYAPVGTAQGRELMQRRAFRVADEAVRVWAPMALDKAGRSKDAARLRSLPPTYAANAAAAEHLVLPLVLELCAMGREDIPQQHSLCDLPQAVTRCE
jgi:hypothetical protein